MFVVSYGAMISVTLCMPYPVDTCGYNYFESWIYPFASHMGFRVGIKNRNDIYVYHWLQGLSCFLLPFHTSSHSFFSVQSGNHGKWDVSQDPFPVFREPFGKLRRGRVIFRWVSWVSFFVFFEGRIFWRQSSQKESFKQEAKESFQSKSDWARTNIFCALMTNAQDFSWWSLGILKATQHLN